MATYALAYTGTWLALLTPVLVTIAMRVRQLAPTDSAQSVSWVLAIGAMFALMGNPLFGRLSDRTTSRFGMRRPWLIGGMLCGSAALLMIATAQSLAVVLIGWCLAQLAFNAVLAAIVAVLPDQVPAEQRGAAAGVLGICLPLGQLCGTFVVHLVSGSIAGRVHASCGDRLRRRAAVGDQVERSPPRHHRRCCRRSTLAELLRSYWVNPLRHRDFAWAWLSRFMLVLGTAFLTTYQTFYLIEKLGYGEAEVPTLIFKGMLAQASAIVLLSLLGGQLSDAIGRRKVFVICGACGLCGRAVDHRQRHVVFDVPRRHGHDRRRSRLVLRRRPRAGHRRVAGSPAGRGEGSRHPQRRQRVAPVGRARDRADHPRRSAAATICGCISRPAVSHCSDHSRFCQCAACKLTAQSNAGKKRCGLVDQVCPVAFASSALQRSNFSASSCSDLFARAAGRP